MANNTNSKTKDSTSDQKTTRAFKAILFDLDGTLLPLSLEAFLERYLNSMHDFFTEQGLDGKRETYNLMQATNAMRDSEDILNDEKFWSAYSELTQRSRKDYEPILDNYYRTHFNAIGTELVPSETMIQIVHALKRKGYPLAVATMPFFPEIAVHERLHWAGMDIDDFEFVTHYETERALKPSTTFFADVCARMNVDPHEVLMIGNNTLEDGNAQSIGCTVYIVEDFIIEPENALPKETFLHGSAKDLLEWVQDFPPYEPA
ncbi:MAG: HAD family hydrolase [Eggerthellaceae bacterium]|nr:HAD family hydrolase [Eggerthellaceae bacterium]